MIRAVLLFFGLAALTGSSCGYSLLTHEEIVDIAWNDDVVPLLLKRYPAATDKQLHEAHAYAYGGCLLEDIGYYRFHQVPFWINFGDAGIGYAFINAAATEGRFLWQCLLNARNRPRKGRK